MEMDRSEEFRVHLGGRTPGMWSPTIWGVEKWGIIKNGAQECVFDEWWEAGPFVEPKQPVEGTNVERARSEKLPPL